MAKRQGKDENRVLADPQPIREISGEVVVQVASPIILLAFVPALQLAILHVKLVAQLPLLERVSKIGSASS